MGKLEKYMQSGGKNNSAIVENKEYVKTLAGEILKIKDAPKHEDKILKVNNVNKKVAFGKGGVLMPNIESAISATHENRKPKDRLYTKKDEEIKIMPLEVKAIGKTLSLPVKLQKKAISPSKLLDLLIEKRNTTISRYKDPINDRESTERFNAIAANKSVLATLPSKEDLYDVVFELQESKKSSDSELVAQRGVNLDKLIEKKKSYFKKEENLGKYPKTKKLFTAQQGLSTSIERNPNMSKFLNPPITNNQANKRLLNITKQGYGNLESLKDTLSDFNEATELGYVNDKNLLTVKDFKYNKRHNQSTPQTMVRDIARAAKVSGIPLESALAIAQRETSLGSQAYNPQTVYSNWESRYMGIPNSSNNEPGDQLTPEELDKVRSYAKNSLKYPFASEMNTIKEKTKKYGLRGYNYGDPDYPNKIAQEVEILRNPVNSKFMKFADSVYNATPKNYFDKKQTGGKLKKYMC